jgi:hypothetical protein
MKIAVLGAGKVGSILAYGLLNAGHEVLFGVRDPEGRTGFSAPVATVAEAVAGAETVVNALPGGVTLDLLQQVGAETFAGKVLIDVANAITPDYMLLYPQDSLGAKLQAALPSAHVVKTLNTVPADVMEDPRSLPADTTVFLSGNDRAAKETVGRLLADLGWRHEVQFDLGGIDTARATEHYLYLSLALLTATRSTAYNIAVVT